MADDVWKFRKFDVEDLARMRQNLRDDISRMLHDWHMETRVHPDREPTLERTDLNDAQMMAIHGAFMTLTELHKAHGTATIIKKELEELE